METSAWGTRPPTGTAPVEAAADPGAASRGTGTGTASVRGIVDETGELVITVSDPPVERRRVALQRPGPLLVEGPVEVVLEDGTTVSSDRFCVALCTCRRSRIYPWCDTSHRRRERGSDNHRRSRPPPD